MSKLDSELFVLTANNTEEEMTAYKNRLHLICEIYKLQIEIEGLKKKVKKLIHFHTH